MRRLNNRSKKNQIYQAFREVGRAVRTIVLLRYLSDPGLREQIQRATNKAEAYNGFTKWLHFGNAGVTLRDPAHLARMQQVFALAQRRRAPVLVHMRARGGSNYGEEEAHLFLDKLVASAPDVEIVVAHFGASGPGYPPQNDEVMAVFAGAAERKDRRMENVYFDVATNVTDEITPADAALVARRIRQVGPARVLDGSDLSPPGGSVRRGWEIFRSRIPLTPAELQQIANNRTRFAR